MSPGIPDGAPHTPTTVALGAAVVAVNPVPYGWAVETSFSENPLLFCSGAWAEHAGRQLAQAAARSGLIVDFRIFTRDGKLAQQRHYWSNGQGAANQA